MPKINIDTIKDEIVKALKPLKPKKILLFGSYAYGKPDENSDIDLFLIKNISKEKARDFKVQARLNLRKLIQKHKIGFDILVADEEFISNRNDYFYKYELKNAKVLYE
jgi:predicted nucleotidyltransferase